MDVDSDLTIGSNDARQIDPSSSTVDCSCSLDQILVAKHYDMLSHAIVLDKPDDFTEENAKQWCELAQFALRVILLGSSSPSASSQRFQSLRMLLGQMIILATTSSSTMLMTFLAASLADQERYPSAKTLVDALLFAYRQHSYSSSSSHRNFNNESIIVLLNTFFTILVGHAKRSHFGGLEIHRDWKQLLSTTLPSLLSSTKTLASNTLQESSLQQLCEGMSEEERTTHIKLSHLFRVMLSSNLAQPSIKVDGI